ncbi:MAG: membrane protein insertion efficiency factor YidD [Steroidobacteraceae bacterium]
MKKLLQLPIHLYRWFLSPFLGSNCRFHPTCSAYALEAIENHGAWRGCFLAVKRVCRCHPWGAAGYDPVPGVRQA